VVELERLFRNRVLPALCMQAGDCGWLWLMKHDWYSPYSIINSSTAYPSPQASYGGNGGIDGTGNFNLTLSQTYGPMAALFSLPTMM